MITDTLSSENCAISTTSTTAPLARPDQPSDPSEASPLRGRPRNDPLRCHYRYPNGRRCTLPGLSARSGLCLRHYNRQVAAGLPLVPSFNDADDLSEDLLPELSQSSSLVDLRKFLSRLLVLVTQGRVSPRRASVLSYITYQLVHSAVPSKKRPALSPINSSLFRLAQNVTEQAHREGMANDH